MTTYSRRPGSSNNKADTPDRGSENARSMQRGLLVSTEEDEATKSRPRGSIKGRLIQQPLGFTRPVGQSTM